MFGCLIACPQCGGSAARSGHGNHRDPAWRPTAGYVHRYIYRPGCLLGGKLKKELANESSQSRSQSGRQALEVQPGTRGRAKRGLTIESQFCPPDVADPFDTVAWELRTAAIKGEDGEVLFEQPNCEIPATWTQLATNVVVSKYFYGENGTPEREQSVRQLIHRVCRTIADWGVQDQYFATPEDGERFYRDLTWLCLHQVASFNSPVWFNIGLYHHYGVQGAMCSWHWDAAENAAIQPDNPYEYPQASACFIQSVQDNMEDIMELARSEAMLFKFGSGTGTDLSTLRSHREKLSGGGRPSGPLSFMRVYDQIAAVVKSGGKTRRAAKMQSLKVWHPDILEFIECKQREEKKARLLIAQGYEPDDAYSSVLFQNANLSVRVSDEFMEAARRPALDHALGHRAEPARPDPQRPRHARRNCRRGLVLRRPGAPVRHDDQPLEHVSQFGADQRQQPVRDRRYAGGHVGRLSPHPRAGRANNRRHRRRRSCRGCGSHFPHGPQAGLRAEDSRRLSPAIDRGPSGLHAQPRRRAGRGIDRR